MGASTSSPGQVYNLSDSDNQSNGSAITGTSNSGPVSADGKAAACLTSSDEEIVNLMFPVYYLTAPITQDEIQLAKDSWMLVVQNKGKRFLELQAAGNNNNNNNNDGNIVNDDDDNTPLSCISLFFETFYARLFDSHPEAEFMFSNGIKRQGKFLVSMISVSLNLLNNEEKFREKMIALAEVHNTRGIKANEYGLVGDVLFYSLHHVLGSEAYDRKCHVAWVKVFSNMLKYIIPNAVAYEIKTKSADQKRRLLEMSGKEL